MKSFIKTGSAIILTSCDSMTNLTSNESRGVVLSGAVSRRTGRGGGGGGCAGTTWTNGSLVISVSGTKNSLELTASCSLFHTLPTPTIIPPLPHSSPRSPPLAACLPVSSTSIRPRRSEINSWLALEGASLSRWLDGWDARPEALVRGTGTQGVSPSVKDVVMTKWTSCQGGVECGREQDGAGGRRETGEHLFCDQPGANSSSVVWS